MRDAPRGSAPNYTVPALVMAAINLFWMLGVIWALYGLPVVLGVAWALHAGLDLMQGRGRRS